MEPSMKPTAEDAHEAQREVLDATDPNRAHSSQTAMLTYYPRQNICTVKEWQTVLRSLQVPWQVTGRMNLSLGWAGHTFAALPAAEGLPHFPQPGVLLLGDAEALQPETNKALHATLILLQKSGELYTQELASMLPPLLLDVAPHHRILDLCAAPGSKTLQILDIMQRALPSGAPPAGLLVANDVDAKRLQQVVERAQVLPRSPLVCSCVAAQKFPALLTSDRGQHRFATWTKASQREPDGQFKLKFDRVLCDVPCSSDGGIRKGVRRQWSAGDGLALHPKQVGILLRGLELLAPEGLLVYSTCSLNPIEDEAVVAAALKEVACQGVELLDGHVLDGVHCCRGLQTWQVPHPEFGTAGDEFLAKHGATDGFYHHMSAVPALLRGGKIRATMFPPTGSDTEWLSSQLQKCVRVLPSSTTGGFFMALFKKKLPQRTLQGGSGDQSAPRTSSGKEQEQAEEEEEEEASDDKASKAGEQIHAGCHVLVKSTGAPAVVIGPGSGKYRDLVKIRYPDRTTYHLSAEDIACTMSSKSSAGTEGKLECGQAKSSERERRPGARLFRSLGEKSPNLSAFIAFFGLFREHCAAEAAGAEVFPVERLCFKPKDKTTLYLVSGGLLSLRVPRGYWPVASGMPLLRLVAADEQVRWGAACPLRPCREAAPLLARCATRRRMVLRAEVFSQLMSKRMISTEDLLSFAAAEQLAGFPSEASQASALERGAVVVILLGPKPPVRRTFVPPKALPVAEVAVIGSLTTEGLEVFLENDTRLRLAVIADELAGRIATGGYPETST